MKVCSKGVARAWGTASKSNIKITTVEILNEEVAIGKKLIIKKVI